MRHDLAISFGQELAAIGDQFVAQRLEILDDAVVDQGHRSGDVRMRVADGRRAVRRPARVCDADGPAERVRVELGGQIFELALGPPALQPAAVDGADARRVIAAILEALQAIEQPLRDSGIPCNADDSAHYSAAALRVILSRKRWAQPAMPVCAPRATARLCASTSSVITDPAPTTAPSPILTGATSALFEPMNALAPIVVRCLV